MDDKSSKVGTNTVIIKRLNAEHAQDTFRKYMPLGSDMKKEVSGTVRDILDRLGGKSLIKSSGDVYIKPNAVDSRPYTHTRPEVVEAVIRYWLDAGARKVYLIENSTQCNITRLVYELTGYAKICRDTGAIPVYLDEEKTVTLKFTGKKAVTEGDPEGYERTEFQISKTVAEKLIAARNENLYVDLPKLKTHSMGVVTLGIKNQWGFPRHGDRGADHNYNLHSKLVDVLSHVRPDVTLIEGVEGTIYGHYPVIAFADECVKPFKILIGGLNVVAVDMVGAGVFGLGIEDVPQIKLAIERGLSEGVRNAGDIDLIGDYSDPEHIDVLGDLDDYGGKYPHDLYPKFPDDVKVIEGSEMACKEGCVCNPRTLLQVLTYDYGARGGWNLIMGRGFDMSVVDSIEGPVVIAGKCAIEEVSERLIKRLGKGKVYLSGECNDLRATTEAMCHVTKVNPMKFAPISLGKAAGILAKAYMHRTQAKLVNPLCHLVKLR